MEIAGLLLNHQTETAIAQDLHISAHTVHSHIERLYRKLDVHSQSELIIRLFETYVWLHRGEYDLSRAKRDPSVPGQTGKTQITIWVEDDVVQWFKTLVHKAGGGNYQTLMNRALREYMNKANESLEDVLRRIVREELRNGT